MSLSTLAPQFNGVSRSTQLKVSRLALMTDIPGASHGQKANFHYAVEMTPEASWEVELQHWYDSEHLPGLLNDAAFEFDAHIPHALKAGFAQNKIDALREHTISDLFTEEERLLLELTDRMTRDVKVPEELMARVSARREPGEVVELVATVAAYNMVSRFLVALNISH
ncbi:MAG: carboxymuconolactone decarboxylase family protein [Acidovorax sp.]|uniref:carboxymuconolactone decarboxylase family protein n=1 Tax=Acidovorax sp. TaxID=1872122 RepID=UPI00391D78BB